MRATCSGDRRCGAAPGPPASAPAPTTASTTAAPAGEADRERRRHEHGDDEHGRGPRRPTPGRRPTTEETRPGRPGRRYTTYAPSTERARGEQASGTSSGDRDGGHPALSRPGVPGSLRAGRWLWSTHSLSRQTSVWIEPPSTPMSAKMATARLSSSIASRGVPGRGAPGRAGPAGPPRGGGRRSRRTPPAPPRAAPRPGEVARHPLDAGQPVGGRHLGGGVAELGGPLEARGERAAGGGEVAATGGQETGDRAGVGQRGVVAGLLGQRRRARRRARRRGRCRPGGGR